MLESDSTQLPSTGTSAAPIGAATSAAGVPRVSIGMPVYNGERYLTEAIAAVLGQTFVDFELIICDNGSTDRTADIVADFARRDPRVSYHRNPTNIGAAKNFNRCVELARGEYFRWAAHDDLIAPTLIEKCVTVLDSAPAHVVTVYPRRQFIHHDGSHSRDAGVDNSDVEPLATYHKISFRQIIRLPGWTIPMLEFGLHRLAALRKTRLQGTYRASDIVLMCELSLLGELWEIPETLFFQRLHDDSPEWEQRGDLQGEAIWLDPSNTQAVGDPGRRLFREQLQAVRRSKVGCVTKAARYLDLATYAGSKLLRRLRMLPPLRPAQRAVPRVSPTIRSFHA